MNGRAAVSDRHHGLKRLSVSCEPSNPLLDPILPDRLRAMADDLERLAVVTRGILEGVAPPPLRASLGAAHAYARELEARAAGFLAWVDSPDFPAIAAQQRDRFRTAGGRLMTSARRLGVATERRRVDELIERADEAMQQAGVLFRRAHEGVLRDAQVQTEAMVRDGQ
jgi:hypothetical protein